MQLFMSDDCVTGYLPEDPCGSDSDGNDGGGSGAQHKPSGNPSGRAVASGNAGGRSSNLQNAPSVDWMMKSVRNADVVDTIVTSMKKRYCHDSPSIRRLEKLRRTLGRPDAPPEKSFRVCHFGCTFVVVDTHDTRRQCLDYIHRNRTLSLDMEHPAPRHKGESVCALI